MKAASTAGERRRVALMVLANVGAILLLLVTLNGIAAAFLATIAWSERRFPSKADDPRVNLPAYEDKDFARRLYREFAQVKGRYAPYAGWAMREQHGELINVNADGTRRTISPGREIAAQAPRAHLFGGSTAWGTGAADSATIPSHLQALTGWRFTNEGQSGFTTRQSLARFINILGEGGRIDFAISYEGINDVAMLCNANLSLQGNSQELVIKDFVEKGRAKDYLWDSFVGSTFDAVKYVNDWIAYKTKGRAMNIGPRANYVCDKDAVRADAVANLVMRHWHMAQQIAEASGGKYFAFLQPTPYRGRADTGYFPLDPTVRRQYDAVYPLLQARVQASGNPRLVDIADTLDDKKLVYVDWAHLTGRGNEIVAQRIVSELGRLVKLD